MEVIKKAIVALFGYSKAEWTIGGLLATLGGAIAAMLGGNDIFFKGAALSNGF